MRLKQIYGLKGKNRSTQRPIIVLFSLTTPISTLLGRVRWNKWNSQSPHRKPMISPKLSLNTVCRQQSQVKPHCPVTSEEHKDPNRRALNLLEWSVVAVLKLQIILKKASSHFNCVLGPIYEDGPCRGSQHL